MISARSLGVGLGGSDVVRVFPRIGGPTVTATPPKYFSMLREFHVADVLSLANAACGLAAVFFAMRYMSSRLPLHFFAATALSPAALLFDGFAGLVARRLHQQSVLGRELDSLADIISFGVAPATLGFAAGLQGGWDWIALIYFVCCGVSRLARYNVTAESLSLGRDRVAYFEGTPIPTTVLLTSILAFAAWQDRLGEYLYWGAWAVGPWDLHPLSLMFVFSGTLMISKTLRIPKL
jgi:CDP-diacylglycerol--serine O-phosphatidyltransferase